MKNKKLIILQYIKFFKHNYELNFCYKLLAWEVETQFIPEKFFSLKVNLTFFVPS